MELKEFIKTVLKDVIEAVEESREEIKIGTICPDVHNQQVEFDIAVSTENTVQGGGKAKVNVMGLVEVGGDAGKAVTNTNVSRIKFHVSIAFSEKSN